MRMTLTSRSSTITLTSLLALGIAACSSSSGGTGAGGTTGSGTGGTSSAGHGGGGTTGSGGSIGTAGTTGSGGSTGPGGTTGTGGITGTGGTGETGGSPGTGGTTGTGGSAGGSTGTAGTAGGFTPYACSGTFAAPAIPAGSAATRIAGAPPSDAFNNSGNNFTNVEGPVWIGNALYFSEMVNSPNPPPARILKIDANDTVTMFYPASGTGGDSGSNGLAVDGTGRLISANHGVGGIVAFNVATQTEVTPPIISMFGGKRFNSPNDLTIRNDGTIYFTDPNFQAPSPAPQSTTGVYMVPPGSTTATEILSSLSNPNGITLSLDQQTLYVGHGGGVYSYSVSSNGTIGATATHVDPADLDNNATDGMAIDCAGDLYVVRPNTKDIVVVGFGGNPAAAGTKLGTIGGIVGNGQLTNIAFGGADHKTLYITAQGTGTGATAQRGVFKLAMPIPGMPY
jgi:gluconolactonase